MKSHKSRLAIVAAVILIVAGASLVSRRPTFSRPQTNGCGVLPCGGQGAQPTAHEFDFPYYSLRDGFDSTLFLVSDSPQPIDFALAFHSLSGRPLAAPAMTIQPHAKLTVNLNKLLRKIASDDPDDFAEGSLSVRYLGIGPMPLASQVTVTNPGLHWVYESQMVENDPGMMSDIPAVLNSAWWGLEAGRDATIAVSNVADHGTAADVFLDFHGSRHAVGHRAGLRFRAHETKLLSITRLLGDLELSPTQVPEGGITIMARGQVPTLIGHGHVLDPNTGFSTTLSFPEPGLQKASALHASAVPIGTAPKDSPYADAGSFIPHVIVRNLAASAQTVTLTVEYPSEEGPAQTALPPRLLAAYSTEDISLDSVIDQLPLPLPFCSIRIEYSGTPGSVMAEVSSVEEERDLVIDSKLANEGDAMAGSGAYPWHLDAQTESILFLTNMSDRNVRIGFQVHANGVSYSLTKLKLGAHETRAIDLRKLRDAQEPDFQEHRIPAQATDGSVLWAKSENVPVMGRMMVVRRHQGIASSYSCPFGCQCGIVLSFVKVTVTPPTVSGLPGDTQQLLCVQEKDDCHGTAFYFDITGFATWLSGDPTVATINSTGFANAVGPGRTYLAAQFTDLEYYWDDFRSNCVERQRTEASSATCAVQAPTSVGYVSTTVQGPAACNPGTAGWSRTVTLELRDQVGQPIRRAGITMADTIRVGSPNDLGASDTHTGSFSTDSLGRWPDTFFVCSSVCPASAGSTTALQYWTYNGLALPHVNTVIYKCGSITIEGF